MQGLQRLPIVGGWLQQPCPPQPIAEHDAGLVWHRAHLAFGEADKRFILVGG